MIAIGLSINERAEKVSEYVKKHGIMKVVVFGVPALRGEFPCGVPVQYIDWSEIIMYRTFYRLIQEVGSQTLLVLDSCMRNKDRNCLTYNCLRHVLNQTTHQLIFEPLPIIDTIDDFMILFDFDTRSRYKRSPFSQDLLGECSISIKPVRPSLSEFRVITSKATKALYQREKRARIEGIGLKDPHTIPRNLYLIGASTKFDAISDLDDVHFVARSRRPKATNIHGYGESSYPHAPYRVIEFPHDFSTFRDFMTAAKQVMFEVVTTDLKVDAWYFARYTDWCQRVSDAFDSLQ